jgi:exodeoxyribonuclease V gamma subunit
MTHSDSDFDLTPGLAMIHSDRMEDLRSALMGWIKANPLPPFENEIILVQSNGIRQWLRMGFASNEVLGISADTDFLLPSPFIWQCYRAVLDAERVPRSSPFDRAPLIWRIYRQIPDRIAKDPERYATLKRFLERNPHPIKPYQLALQLADLFDQYQVHRSDWLLDWAEGKDILKKREEGTASLDIPPDQRWQPDFWRALIEDLGEHWEINSRSRLHTKFISRLHEIADQGEPIPPGLSRRIIIFGISSLPRQVLETLAALSRVCQVLYFVHNPCRYYWADIIEGKELLSESSRRFAKKEGFPSVLEDQDLHRFGNPLLASWGKQGRDYVKLLDEWDDLATSQKIFKNDINLFSEDLPDASSLLQQVQNGILELLPLPSEAERTRPIGKDDDSITFHVAHSPQREIEILHDQLLRIFDQKEDSPSSIQPRDVIVMLPDIDRYAPHIEAVFGQQPDPSIENPPPAIPYSIADRKTRGHDPICKAMEALLDLPASRFAASEILDLLEVEALQRRFGLKVPDVSLLQRWIRDAGIRWGIDVEHRSEGEFHAPIDPTLSLNQNTWDFGFKRLFLGYAMGHGDAFEGITPYPEIGGMEGPILGALRDLLNSLQSLRDRLKAEAIPEAWVALFKELIDAFFQPQGSEEERSVALLRETLDQWYRQVAEAGLTTSLPLAIVKEAWISKLDEPRLTQRFLGGSVNFCTLMPMRSIPFKVVCLLGMNAADFPRLQPQRTFDLLQTPNTYRPGDRSRRDDDRYMFLEALLSASERLLISWVGRNIRDHSERQASVLVNQLRDHLAGGWHLEGDEAPEKRIPAGKRLLHHLTTEYPLQPFSARYFDSADERLFTYSNEWARTHGEAQSHQDETAPLPPPDIESTLDLKALARFLKNPSQHFLNQRLNVYFERGESVGDDDESFVFTNLNVYTIGEKVFESLDALKDDSEDGIFKKVLSKVRQEGQFPLGASGDLVQDHLEITLQTILDEEARLKAEWPEVLDQPLELPPLHFKTESGLERTLEDWLFHLRRHASGEDRYALIERTPSKIYQKSKPRLEKLLSLWVRHLAAHAGGLSLSSYLIGVDGLIALPALTSREKALAHLTAIVQAFDVGLSAPLPIAPQSAFAALEKSESASEARLNAIRGAYEGNILFDGEVGRSPYLRRTYPSLEALLEASVHDLGFIDWADRLYRPLHEAFHANGDPA